MQATTAIARRQPPCQGAATPTAGAAAPAVGPPLRPSRCKRLCTQAAVAPTGWLQSVVPVGGASAHKRCPCGLLPLRAAAAPCGRRWPPFWTGPGRSQGPLWVAGRPSYSLHSLRKRSKNIRMEKIKEVKRHPL
ncbi:hypothetical protein BHE74_00048236 [Ensete ventricosum]|nr:hypothetical protein BHE74_00048236 [Ensete ventricosum]